MLDTNIPGVQVGADKICNICHEYDRIHAARERTKKKRDLQFRRLIERIRMRHAPYDLLVPLSGGKDSTYVLFYCNRILGLKCLAVTWDNGFLTEHAYNNIRNVCSKLGVDHIFYGLERERLRRLYSYCFKKTGFFCPICMRGISVATARTQLAFNIPLAVLGTSPQTEEHVMPEYFISGDVNFLESVFRDSPLVEHIRVLLEPVGLLHMPPQIYLSQYIEWDYDLIYKTIIGELGWVSHKEKAEHTDCALDPLVQHIRFRKYPALTPEKLRFSKLVTAGLMDREEALENVQLSANEAAMSSGSARSLLETLDITPDEFESAISDPLRHMIHLKSDSRIKRRLRALRRHFQI
jgi:hypothetical protein